MRYSVKYGLIKKASYEQESDMSPWLWALLLGGGALGAGYLARDHIGPLGKLYKADTWKDLWESINNRFNNGGMSPVASDALATASLYNEAAKADGGTGV